VVVVVVVVGIGLAIWSSRNSPDGAKVGDCVRSIGSDSVEIIACTDPAAQYKVVGRIENQTAIMARVAACDPFPDATQVFWSGQSGGTGYVLCLAANH
jgi:hypothetical protein